VKFILCRAIFWANTRRHTSSILRYNNILIFTYKVSYRKQIARQHSCYKNFGLLRPGAW